MTTRASPRSVMRHDEVDLDGPLHFVEWAGDGETTFVLVHGLGGSHVNWLGVAPSLAGRGRVIAPDLPGFGFTAPHGRTSTVRSLRRILGRFIAEVADGPVVLVGNSMGGLLSLLQAAAHPEHVASLVLANAAIPRPLRAGVDLDVATRFVAYALPMVGEYQMRRRNGRMGAEGMVHDVLELCCVDPARVVEAQPDVYKAHLEMARYRVEQDWTAPRFMEAARTLIPVLARRRLMRDVIARIEAPGLIVHGARDRLVPLAAARQLARQRPDWTLAVMDDVGHIPQVEAPEEFAALVGAWLDGTLQA